MNDITFLKDFAWRQGNYLRTRGHVAYPCAVISRRQVEREIVVAKSYSMFVNGLRRTHETYGYETTSSFEYAVETLVVVIDDKQWCIKVYEGTMGSNTNVSVKVKMTQMDLQQFMHGHTGLTTFMVPVYDLDPIKHIRGPLMAMAMARVIAGLKLMVSIQREIINNYEWYFKNIN